MIQIVDRPLIPLEQISKSLQLTDILISIHDEEDKDLIDDSFPSLYNSFILPPLG